MRRGWEAVGVMGLTCLMLGATESSTGVDLFGPRWVQPALFIAAALSCCAVFFWPDASFTRAGSGVLVSGCFAWRAVAAAVTDLFLGGGRPLFAVVLYFGFAAYVSLTWHRVLPAPSLVRARVREWTGEL